MKQNFKIGKIFLFIIALFCVFLNCEIGFCSNEPGTPELLDNYGGLGSSQVPSLTAEEINNKVMQQSGSGQNDKAYASKQEVEQKKYYMPGDSQLPSLATEDIEETQQSDSGQDDETSALKQEVEQQDQKNIEDNGGNQQSKQVDLDQEKEIDNSKQEVEQQDQESVEDDDQRGKQVKVVTTIKNVYSPIDISGSIFDSTAVAIKDDLDSFNVENEYFGIKVGFDYNFYLKKNESDDFNKYIVLNPKFFGVDNIYFSIFNYHNFLRNKHTNSEDFKKNYYTLYTKSNIDEINSVYFGASVGYIPFKSVIDDSDKNFKKYMLFVSLNTDFDLMLFNNSVYFSNLLTLDFNLLRSNYLVNSNKSNEYIKIKEGMLLNYEIDSLTDLFVGVDFSVYTMHKKFRKNIGLNKNTECNLVTGIKFEFGSINISLGNRGVGLGLSMSY